MQIWRSKACLPAESFLGHPQLPFRTALEERTAGAWPVWTSLISLTSASSLSIKQAEFDPMKFCVSNIRKGVYISNRILGPRLMLSHGLGLGTVRKDGSSPGPGLRWVPCQKFHITDDCKPVLRTTCQTSFVFFMTQKSLELSVLFQTPGALAGGRCS